MKKAVLTGIFSLLVAIMTVVMPVYAQEEIYDESDKTEKNVQEDTNEELQIINLAELHKEGKLIAEYESSFEYTGDEIEPKLTLYVKVEDESGEEKTVKFSNDYYDVKYNNNIHVGDKAEIIIKALEENVEIAESQDGAIKKKYCGEFTVNFKITPKSLERAKGTLRYSRMKYTGKYLMPTVTVELDGKELVNGQDYSVIYSNNKEIGTATVTVTGKGNYTGYILPLTFKIVVGVPKLSTASAYNKVSVKWNQIPGATKYVLERSNSKKSGFKKIATIKNGSALKYVDKNVKFNSTYYYRIRAYCGSEKSKYSAVVSQKAMLGKATVTKVSRASYNSLKIAWKKVTGASRYAVYRSDSEDGKYKRIATIKSPSKLTYTDKKLSCGKTYYYKVAAYRKSKGKNYYGNKSASASANTVPTKISFTGSLTSDDTKIELYWKKSSGATGYTIYRSIEKNSGYEKVKEITKNKTVKWTDDGLDEKQVYYYKIRPYVTRNGKKIYGSYSSVFTKQIVSEKENSISQYTKVPYRWNGSTPKGWDCSGFTKWAMKYLYGIEIGSNSAAQAAGGKSVSKSDRSKWQFGDILVYSSGGRINHVALYIGNNKIMHALNSKYDTIIHDVDYYENWDKRNTLKCVRRYR